MADSTTLFGIATDTLTMVGAITGGLTGLFNFWWQWSDRSERIRVRYGRIRPDISDYEALNVINRGKSPVTVADYGLILGNGKLLSIPLYLELADLESLEEQETFSTSKLTIAPSESFEAGMSVQGQIDGVWARLATHDRPRLAFCSRVPIWQRAWLRLRHTIKPAYS